MVGQRLGGRFEVLGVLGRGGMGVVYLARDLQRGGEVALKLLRRVPDGRALERFRREGEVARRLDHPGIVRLVDAGDLQGLPFLAYEVVPGARSASEAFAELPRRARVELVRDAARALGHAHTRGIAHRDVKPSNLLVDDGGRIRVADFGLALARGQERLTLTGGVAGTPHYMAPEQLSGRRPLVGPESDVWALGVVLYEALAGRRPFRAESAVELMAQITQGFFDPPTELDPSVPRALEAVCLKALEVDQADRYLDGEALARDLDVWLAGGALPGSRRGPGGRRRRLLLAGQVVLAIIAAGLWWGALRDRPAAPGGGASGEVTEAPAPPGPLDAGPLPPPTPEPAASGSAGAPEPAGAPEVAGGLSLGQRLSAAAAARARWVDAERVLVWTEGGEVVLWRLGEPAEAIDRWRVEGIADLEVVDGSLFVAAGAAGLTVQELTAAPPQRMGASIQPKGPLRDVAVALRGQRLHVILGAERSLDSYLLGARRVISRLPYASPRAAAFAAGGRELVVAEAGEAPRLLVHPLDGDGGEARSVPLPGAPTTLALDVEAAWALVGMVEGRLILAPLADPRAARELAGPAAATSALFNPPAHEGEVTAVTFLPGGGLLSAAGPELVRWTEGGAQVERWTASAAVTSLEARGERVLVGRSDGRIEVWEARD